MIGGLPCRASELVDFHYSGGEVGALASCTLAKPKTLGGIDLAAGTEVSLDEQGQPTEARIHAPHTVAGQRREPPGRLLFEAGAFKSFEPGS